MKKSLGAFLFAAMGVTVAASAASAADKMSFALPGVPPVFSAVVAYVAKDVGIFKKYDLDVDLKPFDSGAAAANAVNAGSVDASLSPTQFVATMVANAGAKVKSIWGMEKSDWLIASMDASKTGCDAMKGQGVGVDSPRGARWIQLNNYLVNACKLTTDKDVPTVPLSTNVATAMASGQIAFGVLHIDDIPVIERMSGKKVTVFAELEKVVPNQHYVVTVVRQDKLAEKRDMYVRLVAALRDASNYMNDPANIDRVAKIAAVAKRDELDAKVALRAYNKMEYWPKGHAGLAKIRLETAIQSQVGIGKASKGKSGINPDKKAPTYDEFVDLSIWKDAQKLKK